MGGGAAPAGGYKADIHHPVPALARFYAHDAFVCGRDAAACRLKGHIERYRKLTAAAYHISQHGRRDQQRGGKKMFEFF